MTTTIVRGGSVLDIAGHRAEPADVLIEGDTIREIGRPGLAAPPGAVTIDARDRLLMPGLVNAHTHGHGGLARGLLGDRVPLELLLTLGPAVNGNRSLEDKHLSATLSAVELIRRGCTAFFDLYAEFPAPTVDGVHAAARAYDDVGIRAVIAPMMADRTLYQALPGLVEALPESARRQVLALSAAPWPASIATCRELLERWPFDRDRVRPALGPTIPLHCTDEFLVACRDLAREHDVALQTHLAESKTQAVLGPARYGGKTLTAHLADLGLLGPRFSAAHGVWLARDDVRRLADAGAGVAHNPLSNLRLGSGIAPVRMMLEAGLRVGVGTDSASSSDAQNMFECTRLAAYLSRVRTPDYTRWVTVEEALTMATEGSAGVLGMDRIGRLAPGYKADVLFLDLGHPGYLPLNDVVVQMVMAESGAAIDSVMVGGRMVLERGRLLTVDEAKLRAQAEAARARLAAANAEATAAARALHPHVGAFCVAMASRPYDLDTREVTL
ncbi:MAG: amidohydrolase [Candidatus Rokuibacteriota bacterium]